MEEDAARACTAPLSIIYFAFAAKNAAAPKRAAILPSARTRREHISLIAADMLDRASPRYDFRHRSYTPTLSERIFLILPKFFARRNTAHTALPAGNAVP